MTSLRSSLTRELRNAGLTRAAIDGLWPEWWSAEAEQSISAMTELRYTVARRLGIAPSSLFEGEPKFVWRDSAKFKNLGDTSQQEQAILTSFGMAVGRALIAGTGRAPFQVFSPEAMRSAVLEAQEFVDLPSVLRTCWDLGIPVVKTNLMPLRQKRMQAMCVEVSGRFAILIGRTTSFPAWIAFVVAHEMGHIFSEHLSEGAALLEMADPLRTPDPDDEERDADRFALAFLTGSPDFPVQADIERYNSAQVADVVARSAPGLQVDPGVLTLCLAHSTGRWKQTMSALKMLPNQHFNEDVGNAINWYASQRLDWGSLPDERAAHIRSVMGSVGDD